MLDVLVGRPARWPKEFGACALELKPGATFDPTGFAEFLSKQRDLGTKWAPRFVRVTDEMPLTGTNKVVKAPLQKAGWDAPDVWWRLNRDDDTYRSLTDEDRAALRDELVAHGRS